MHSDSQFAIQSVELAKTAAQPWDWKDHPQFDLVERIFTAGQHNKNVQKIKAHQNPKEITESLERYHILGNMLANDGAIQAVDNHEVAVCREQQQRHAELEVERADVAALYQLALDLQYARAQFNDVEQTDNLESDSQNPQHTLRESIVQWNPVSEWHIGCVDQQWLVVSTMQMALQ